MIRDQVDFLDAFMPTDLHVLVRFGRWEEILAQPEPADYLPMSRSVWLPTCRSGGHYEPVDDVSTGSNGHSETCVGR